METFEAKLGAVRADTYFLVLQLLDVSGDSLVDLPDEQSGLVNLRHLDLSKNAFTVLPVSVLGGMTSLTHADLSNQPKSHNGPSIDILSSLLPILHRLPGLVKVDLKRNLRPWTNRAVAYLTQAALAGKERDPPVEIGFDFEG